MKTNRGIKKPLGTVWDERQQQNYLRVNSRACNMLWLVLLASAVVQVIVYPREPARWLVEMAVFVLLNMYLSAAYLRAGLWTKARQQPDLRQALLAAGAAAALITALTLVRMLISGRMGSVWFLLIQALIVSLAAFALVMLAGRLYRKKQQKIESALDEEE